MQDADIRWYHYALCKNMKTNWFFDDYENDPVFAANVDSICKSCPIRKFCLEEGIENNETGVWGGVYLINGKMDQSKNSHKEESDWEEIREMITS